jgi:hypothetical protein
MWGSCKHVQEFLGSIKCREFLDQLRGNLILKLGWFNEANYLENDFMA